MSSPGAENSLRKGHLCSSTTSEQFLSPSFFDKLSTYSDVLFVQGGNIEIFAFSFFFFFLYVRSCAVTSVCGVTGNNNTQGEISEALSPGAEH